MSTEVSREQWLANRKNSIGASEVACVLGQDPYRSRYQLWAEKCGFAEPDDLSNNDAVKWGNRLQDTIACGFAADTGRRVEIHDQNVSIAGEHPLSATPDAWQFCDDFTQDSEGLLEIKAPGSRMAADWDGDAPLHYQIQLQAQLAVTSCTWGTIAALIDRKLVWFDYHRNDDFIAAMMPKLREFWELVETQTPPPIDGSASAKSVLLKLHPQDTGGTTNLPEAAVDWDRQIRRAKEHIKKCQAIIDLRENQIKEVLGDATYGVLGNGVRYSWKTQQTGGYVVESRVTRTLRRHKK